MAKQKKKSVNQPKEQLKNPDVSFSINLTMPVKITIISILLLLSACLAYYYIYYAYSINKFYSFPLDDPWIHLQFAKNLAEYGSFSYFKNEIVTAGSTSPLYTIILALGFLVTKNEMWLSYVLGVIFFAMSVFYFYKVSEDSFPKDNWIAIGAALIFVLNKWMVFISVTGMETTMYVFLLVACFYYYHKRNAVLFALMLGLSFWARPDAVAFIASIAADYFLLLYLKQRSPKTNEEIQIFSKSDLIKIAVIAGGIIIAYFAMNLIISGSFLPNTYGAKLKYYSPEFRSRAEFLKVEIWEYFIESAYVLLIIPFFISVIKIAVDSFKLRYNRNLLPLIFIIIFVFIYWYKLPYAHRFGRYMIPLFPFYILLFVYGARKFFKWSSGFLNDKKLINGLNIILITVTVFYFASDYIKQKELYQDQSRHIYIRQVEAGRWLKQNTPEGSVVAAHDVGAVAFYSDRKIIDVVGLINPEFIPSINSKDFVSFTQQELKKYNVSYVVFMKEWFRVVNKEPLFRAGDKNFEVMEIYKYNPDSTHILSNEVNSALLYISDLFVSKQFQQAAGILNQLTAADPQSSVTYYLLAYTQSAMGDNVSAEKNLLNAIKIYPSYKDAVTVLGNMYKTQNRNADAKKLYENFLQVNPSDSVILKRYSEISDTVKIK